jgi:hypothetical protein
VLDVARNLRKSANKFVRDNIYFNADLSPIEAKAAYERRQARRSQPIEEGVGEGESGNVEMAEEGGMGAWGSATAGNISRTTSGFRSDYTVWNSSRVSDRSLNRSNLIVCGSNVNNSSGLYGANQNPAGLHLDPLADTFLPAMGPSLAEGSSLNEGGPSDI